MVMRICGKVGCNKLVKKEEKYCEAHRKDYENTVKENHRWYKQNRDDEWEQSFYKSNEWLDARVNVLLRDIHLCRLCLLEKKIINATLVHHIVELKEDRELALDEENLLSLCDACHKHTHIDYKSSRKEEIQAFLKGLATPPPISGFSTLL